MKEFYTSGQAARKLRISTSTLKRWVNEADFKIEDRRNYNGWRLFSESDIEALRKHKRLRKRNGKQFHDVTLLPISYRTKIADFNRKVS